ncbi:MAG: metallophosphoesterase [Pseudomonadota bacterium]
MFRFIHSADLHLGRRFANLAEPPDGTLRGRLREARHQAIPRLAAAARIAGAAHILLAGDTFDTATPSPGVLRHALQAMAAEAPQTWWLLPGNHDNLAEGEALWDRIEADAPPNVRVLRDGAPRALEAGAMLLPAPVERRAMGYDPTASLGAVATPPGTLRIGLAHGGVTDFDGSAGHIPPDRAKRAALDYLALGDWHGRRAIGPRTQYSGSPEQDRFRHGRRGVC